MDLSTVQQPELKEIERNALRGVGEAECRQIHSTAWIARHIGTECAKARRILKRLEKQGLVKGVPACRAGYVLFWTLTDSGRTALAIGSD